MVRLFYSSAGLFQGLLPVTSSRARIVIPEWSKTFNWQGWVRLAMNRASQIQTHMDIIRDCVNEPRKQHQLMQDSTLWNQLCTAMDVIEDTDLAMGAYDDDTSGACPGARYLLECC